MDRSTSSKLTWGGVAGGPVSWSRRSGPHVTFSADREPSPRCACQPSAATHSRVSPGRATGAAPPRVKAGQVVVHGKGGPARLGLDARVVDWPSSHGRQRPYGLMIQYGTQRMLNGFFVSISTTCTVRCQRG